MEVLASYLFTLRCIIIRQFKVKISLFFSLFLALAFTNAHGQNVKKIAKLLEKPDYEKAKEAIVKTLEKDSTNFGAMYFNALLFLNKTETYYNLDSARIYIFKSLNYRETANEEQKDDWAKSEIALSNIDSAKMLITKLSFQKAKNPLSLSSILTFLENFPNSPLQNESIYLRDSLAFENTKGIDTWKAYKYYMESYPQSVFYTRSQTKYEWLLYKEKTKDGKLASHRRFLEEFPKTPHRLESEKFIYEYTTYDHSIDNYFAFIKTYPKSPFSKKAAAHIYSIQKNSDKVNWSQLSTLKINIDSLKQLEKLEKYPIIPILADGQYSFLTAFGDTLKTLKCEAIDAQYKCGNLTQQWLKLRNQNTWVVMNRNGFVLSKDILSIVDLSPEILIVQEANGLFAYHKSGYKISELSADKYISLSDQFIAFRSKNKWGILSFEGQILMEANLDNITSAGNLIILEKEKKFDIITAFALNPDNAAPQLSFAFDDYESIGDSLIIAFRGEQETLLDQTLNELIPLAQHQIYLSKDIWYTKKAGKYQIYDFENQQLLDQTYSTILTNGPWLTTKADKIWSLNLRSEIAPKTWVGLDSVALLSENVAFYRKTDSLVLQFQNGQSVLLDANSSITILRSANEKRSSNSFVLYSNKTSKKVFDKNGNSVFDSRYDDIQYLGDSSFTIKTKGKYGIHHIKKGLIVKPIYDHITENDGLAYLLKGDKIGVLDLQTGMLLAPDYLSRPERFMNGYIISKVNKLGVTLDGLKWAIPAEYDALKLWNDTSYWCKKDNKWALITVSGETILNQVDSVKSWDNASSADLYLIKKESSVGVVSPSKGLVVPPSYNEVINIGSSDYPIFFAEQHLKTADFFVVTYFDPNGKVIKSQAYRAHEYSAVHCDQ
jgi:hypothetical protein